MNNAATLTDKIRKVIDAHPGPWRVHDDDDIIVDANDNAVLSADAGAECTAWLTFSSVDVEQVVLMLPILLSTDARYAVNNMHAEILRQRERIAALERSAREADTARRSAEDRAARTERRLQRLRTRVSDALKE